VLLRRVATSKKMKKKEKNTLKYIANSVRKNGYIGEYLGENIYCNEQDRKEEDFIFKCSDKCVHNSPPQSLLPPSNN